MKVIGIMCVKDEADLLPEVLEHLEGKVDEIYAYDDGSIDGTLDVLEESKAVTYLMAKELDSNRLNIARPHYHHLLEKIREDHVGEEVWIIITMGDRFFLNKTPRQIVKEAEAGGYTTVNAVQLDFIRHRAVPWTEENDTFPNYTQSLRRICKWYKWDEECVIAYKLSEESSYLEAKYPWPRGGHTNVQYSKAATGNKLSMEHPYLEHQGRRSPNAFKWRIENGSRKLSSKINLPSTSFKDIQEKQKKWYLQWKLIPWVDTSSLEQLILMYNEDEWKFKAKKRSYWEPLEEGILSHGSHQRKDL